MDMLIYIYLALFLSEMYIFIYLYFVFFHLKEIRGGLPRPHHFPLPRAVGAVLPGGHAGGQGHRKKQPWVASHR